MKAFKKLVCGLLAIVLLVAVLPASVSAEETDERKVFYLAPNGSDNNVGSIDRPFATLTHAIKAMNPGDTLLVRGGIYRNAHMGLYGAVWNKNGDEDNWFTIKNFPGEEPIFDGEWIDWEGTSSNGEMGMFFGACSFFHIQGLEFRNFTQDGIFTRDNCHDFKIVNCTIHDITSLRQGTSAYDGIVIKNGYNFVIEGCEIYNIGYALPIGGMTDHGIYLSENTYNVTIRKCYFHEIPSGSAIHANHTPIGVHDCVYENNLVTYTAKGFALGDGSHDITIRNNTFYMNALTDIYIAGASDPSRYCTIQNNVFGPMEGHSNSLRAYHTEVAVLASLYQNYDNNLYDSSETSHATYVALLNDWASGYERFQQKISWDIWTNTAEANYTDYTDNYFSKYLDTEDTVTGLGQDENSIYNQVLFADPENGDFRLLETYGLTNVGMSGGMWSQVAVTEDWVFPNGTFESSSYTNTWTENSSSSGNGILTAELDSTTAFSGIQSLHINYVDSVNNGTDPTVFCTDWVIPVVGGTEYTLTAKIKGSSTNASNAKLFFNISENSTELHNAIGEGIVQSTDGWVTLSAIFTPTESVNMKIGFSFMGDGDWWIDDVHLTETATIPTSASSSYLDNLVIDGGFESDSYSNTWTTQNAWNHTLTVSTNSNEYCEGLQSGQISYSAIEGKTGQSLWGTYYLDVEADTTYTLTGKVKSGTNNAENAKTYFVLIEKDSTGTTTTKSYYSVGNVITGSTTDWETVTAIFTTTADTGKLSINLAVMGDSGDWYWDDICLQKGEITPDNIIPNGDFESSNYTGTWSIQNAWNHTMSVSADSNEFYEGLKSGHINYVVQEGKTGQSMWGTYYLDVQPETTYTLTGKVKSGANNAENAKTYFVLIEKNSDGTTTTKSYYSVGNVITGSTTDWENVTATFTTTADTGKLSINLSVMGDSGDWYWDNVCLKKVEEEDVESDSDDASGWYEPTGLQLAINNALNTLDAEVEALGQGNYAYWRWADIQRAKANGIIAIRAASTESGVTTALGEAIAAMEAINTIDSGRALMNDEINTAINEIKNYLDPTDYSGLQKEEIEKIQRAFAKMVLLRDTEELILQLSNNAKGLLDAIAAE